MFSLKDVMLLVAVKEVKAQDEILKSIEDIYGDSKDVYAEYAVKWENYYNINHPYVKNCY